MHTLGYSFKPWNEAKAIADGPSIKRYLEETIEEYGIGEHIRYNHHVISASWSSETSRWTVAAKRMAAKGKDTGESGDLQLQLSIDVLGLLQLQTGYTPEFKGRERFAGTVVQPPRMAKRPRLLRQACRGHRFRCHGDDLVPAMAQDVEHITMLQRSPTYVVSSQTKTRWQNLLRKLLPNRLAYAITRWKTFASSSSSIGKPAPTPRENQEEAARHGAQGARRRLRRREALHSGLQPVGPTALPRAPTATCSLPFVLARPPSSPTPSRASRKKASAAIRRGARSRHHRHRDWAQSRCSR